jgi:hypothetical protein
MISLRLFLFENLFFRRLHTYAMMNSPTRKRTRLRIINMERVKLSRSSVMGHWDSGTPDDTSFAISIFPFISRPRQPTSLQQLITNRLGDAFSFNPKCFILEKKAGTLMYIELQLKVKCIVFVCVVG